MKTPIVVKMAAVVAVAALAGCTDLKPLQAQIDGLKTQVSSLQSQVAAAQASQSCCDATNEKLDRMFKRSISK
ncbi:MAG: hypothetical protein EBW14_15995 [Oxalobacteraceae bacterium]|nr:hypothetical protein [Oxalobacteraceae bacterium]